jgi:hypothetical protein
MHPVRLKRLICEHLMSFFAAVLASLVSVSPPINAAAQDVSPQEIKQRRSEAANRQRRVIFNNDGNEVFLFPTDQEVTPENVLAMRTSPLVDSHVDTIVYCTISAGFGLFSHQTESGNILTREQYPDRPGKRNITEDLIEQGNDILQIMVDFSRKHDKEIFWSMRMNDIHDTTHRAPDKPHPLFPPLKTLHPEYLMGDRNRIGLPPYGSWTGVNYGLPEVRELAFRFIEEVCEGYDIDGVELDFFRSPVLFKSHAWGEVVTQEERDALTQFMRRVHRMTHEVSLKRGRPLLISIRVPDSVQYCSAMGIDLPRWLSEGLTDLLVVGGDFLLSPWKDSVALGHRYNVPVYPCLTYEGRKAPWFEWVGTRSTVESYRARALEAWDAGADGIYVFNLFNPRARQWRELGDPEMLLKLDKVYHGSTVTIKFAQQQMPEGLRFRRLPTLSPEYPEILKPGKPLATTLNIGENVLWGRDQGIVPSLSFELQVQELDDTGNITASINGHPQAGAQLVDDWLTYQPKPQWIRQGINEIQISLDAGREPGPIVRDLRLRVTYED